MRTPLRFSIFANILLALAVIALPHDLLSQRGLFRKHAGIKCTHSCTLTYRNAAPWEDDGSFYAFIVNNLKPSGPTELRGHTKIGPKDVSLSLEFADPSLLYIGFTPEFFPDGRLRSIGPEWIGVDGLMDGVAGDLLLECTTFDSDDPFVNPEFMQCLAGPLTFEVRISLTLPVDMHLPTEYGVTYEGEFGGYHRGSDTLRIPIKVDGRDTIATAVVGKELTDVELAALKGFSLRERLKTAMWEHCGPEPSDLASIDADKRGIYPLVWAPIVITGDNPNQSSYAVVRLKLNFGSIVKLSDAMASGKDK